MSKHMQITVTVRPFYEPEMKNVYPRLTRYLKQVDSSLMNQAPSLYDLAGNLETLLYHADGTLFRKVLVRHGEMLRNTHKMVQESIANRQLAQADKLLYVLEDIFDEIESELN